MALISPFLSVCFHALSLSGYLAETLIAPQLLSSPFVASLYALSNFLLNWPLMLAFSSISSNVDGGIILLTYLLHGAESFLSSWLACS